jgi:hypothetical protein
MTRRTSAPRPPRVSLLVALSSCAGVIHARAFIDHDDERVLIPAAVVSLGTVAVWIVSRTVGLPIGPWAGRAEPFGMPDIVASVDELVLAAVILAIVRPERRLAARLAWLNGGHCTRVGWMLSTLSLLVAAVGKHTHPTT